MIKASHVGCASNSPVRRKVLVVIAEDWFALSHFVPLLSELVAQANDVLVTARSSGRLQDIEALGARARHVDFGRGSLNPARLVRARSALARRIADEKPDVVHAIALQSMVMTSLALATSRHRPSAIVLHLTGLGYLGQSRSPMASVVGPLAWAAVRHCMASQSAWLVAENHDDLAVLAAAGPMHPSRTAIIPGAGVDPSVFHYAQPPANEVPRVAFVGRMLVSKGVHVLVEAHRLLRNQGVRIELALHGDADAGSRQAISRKTLAEWNALLDVEWYGQTDDVAGAWAACDMAVVPGLGGDGMPRAMLEAAACGRPLIVSDVPGCRQFVRDGVEGLVVPPNDPDALARAIFRLASNPQLRTEMGAAARQRVLAGYTTDAVRDAYRRLYAELPVRGSAVSAAHQ
jgi:glycosyltransferase involved in cell wall biosynthesis